MLSIINEYYTIIDGDDGDYDYDDDDDDYDDNDCTIIASDFFPAALLFPFYFFFSPNVHPIIINSFSMYLVLDCYYYIRADRRVFAGE